MVIAYLREKVGLFYIVISYYDEQHKRRQRKKPPPKRPPEITEQTISTLTTKHISATKTKKRNNATKAHPTHSRMRFHFWVPQSPPIISTAIRPNTRPSSSSQTES